MSLIAIAAAILNLGSAMMVLPGWVRLTSIALNLAFAAVGAMMGDALVAALHGLLVPFNLALLVGGRDGRRA